MTRPRRLCTCGAPLWHKRSKFRRRGLVALVERKLLV